MTYNNNNLPQTLETLGIHTLYSQESLSSSEGLPSSQEESPGSCEQPASP